MVAASPALIGGQYAAEQNPDGTWNLFAIPVFATLPAGARSNRKAIDRLWMKRAIAKHKQLEGPGKYLPPAHVEHHGEGFRTERVGFFRPRGIGRLVLEGRAEDVIFADVLKIKPEMFARIEDGELPYVSVEVANWDDPQFASLAFLDDDAPHFKFPLITVGEKTVAAKDIITEQFAGRLRGLIESPVGARICFQWSPREKPMGIFGKSEKPTEKFQEDDRKEEEADSMAEVEQDPEPTMRDLMGALSAIGAQLQKIVPVDTGVEGEGRRREDEEPEEFVAEDNAPAEQPTPEEKGTNLSSQADAKMHARLAALEQREKEREHADALSARIAKAQEDLKGYHLSESTQSHLAQAAKGGQEYLDSFVATIKENLTPDPPTNFADYARTGGSAYSPEVEKFSALGPQALELAVAAEALYEKLKGRTSLSKEKFIEHEVSHQRSVIEG